ncbi:LPXTG cell wall anchor domain-containing protein, partial [Streptococcus thermophilus]|uniref:LPXTG cell wall anchor domain-containing protein n=1 Tax=Streptococcus thermophilus TaxID=1308 RepID=UPI0021A44C86
NDDTTDQNFTVHLKHRLTPVNPTDPQTPGAPTKPVQAGQAAATNFVDRRLPQTGETDQQLAMSSLLGLCSLLGLFGMTKRQRKK